MQLKLTTDYAIRILIYMAEKQSLVTSIEIADNMAIPQNYILKIMSKLRNNGLVTAQNGLGGGFILAKKPEDITLYDVISLMEKTIKMNRCLESDGHCSRCATKHCPVHKYFEEMQRKWENHLESTTIASLLDDR